MTIWSHEEPVPGIFNDGAFPVDRPVKVRQSLGELIIADRASGEVLARWPLGALRPVPDARYPDVLRLKLSEGEGGRLAIFDRAFNEGLTEWWPGLRRRLVLDREALLIAARASAASIAGLALLFLAALPWLGRLAAHTVPPPLEKEAAGVFLQHGNVLLQRINAAPVCDTAPVAPLIEKLVEPLRQAAGWRGDIQVRVIDDDLPNAAMVLGGEIVVFKGMLNFARNGDELAGILAHEIGHVVGRHAVRNLFVTSLSFFGVDQFLGDSSGRFVIHPVSGALLILRERRGAEHEADRTAIRLLKSAGFNVRPLADILDRIGYLQGETEIADGWLATHPLSRQRARRIRDAAPVQSRPPVLTAAEFGRLRAVCAPVAPPAAETPVERTVDVDPPALPEGLPVNELPAPEPAPEEGTPEEARKDEAKKEDSQKPAPEPQPAPQPAPEKPRLGDWDTGGG